MSGYLGIIFALTALVSWGFGDFFIQKTTRIVGIWKALFFIGVTGLFALSPFVKNEVFHLEPRSLILLGLLGIVVVFTTLFDFEALRRGKIAIVEPLIGIELPITVGLSMSLGKEHLTPAQLVFIATVFIGIILAITIRHADLHYHRRIFEKGIILAGVGGHRHGTDKFSCWRLKPADFAIGEHLVCPLVTRAHMCYLSYSQGRFQNYLIRRESQPRADYRPKYS